MVYSLLFFYGALELGSEKQLDLCVCVSWTQWDKLIDGNVQLAAMNDSEGTWISNPLCKWPKHS